MKNLKLFFIIWLSNLTLFAGRRDAVADHARSKTSDLTIYYLLGGLALLFIILVIYNFITKNKK